MFGLAGSASGPSNAWHFGSVSAARAAVYLIDDHRTAEAVQLAQGVVADIGSCADDLLLASIVLRRAGMVDEAVAAASMAAARGAEVPTDLLEGRRRLWRRRRGPFSRAA